MFGKIVLEEAWAIRENFKNFDVATLAPKGVIGPDLVANLLDIHGTRIQQMDENGIDMMVLSLSSPGPQGATDPKEAEDLARLANDRLSVEVSRTPARFAALASLSMHDPVQAAEELTRCFTELTGFVGAIINDGMFTSSPFPPKPCPLLTYHLPYQSAGPDRNTMLFYDSPAYDPFWRVAASLNCPIYLHPREPTPLIYSQMWADRPHLAYAALGHAQRVSMHLLGIVTSGVLDRFPTLKLVIGHMGEQIPFDLYRIDHKLNRARFPNMGMSRERLVRDYFGTQIFITTAGNFSTPALLCAMQELGAGSVLFSVGYPFESISNGSVWFDEHVPVSGRDKVDMGRNNALGVFTRLAAWPHALERLSPMQCGVGGLGQKRGIEGEVEYGLYNKSWERREKRVVVEEKVASRGDAGKLARGDTYILK